MGSNEKVPEAVSEKKDLKQEANEAFTELEGKYRQCDENQLSGLNNLLDEITSFEQKYKIEKLDVNKRAEFLFIKGRISYKKILLEKKAQKDRVVVLPHELGIKSGWGTEAQLSVSALTKVLLKENASDDDIKVLQDRLDICHTLIEQAVTLGTGVTVSYRLEQYKRDLAILSEFIFSLRELGKEGKEARKKASSKFKKYFQDAKNTYGWEELSMKEELTQDYYGRPAINVEVFISAKVNEAPSRGARRTYSILYSPKDKRVTISNPLLSTDELINPHISDKSDLTNEMIEKYINQ